MQYVVDTSEFQEVKARLAAIEHRRKVDNDKDKGPSLRRASPSSDKEGSKDGGKGDDGQPTLKKRQE